MATNGMTQDELRVALKQLKLFHKHLLDELYGCPLNKRESLSKSIVQCIDYEQIVVHKLASQGVSNSELKRMINDATE